jgi:hypothetical protein
MIGLADALGLTEADGLGVGLRVRPAFDCFDQRRRVGRGLFVDDIVFGLWLLVGDEVVGDLVGFFDDRLRL